MSNQYTWSLLYNFFKIRIRWRVKKEAGQCTPSGSEKPLVANGRRIIFSTYFSGIIAAVNYNYLWPCIVISFEIEYYCIHFLLIVEFNSDGETSGRLAGWLPGRYDAKTNAIDSRWKSYGEYNFFLSFFLEHSFWLLKLKT